MGGVDVAVRCLPPIANSRFSRECEADAEPFTETRDTLRPEAGVAGESTDGATTPTQP